MKSFSRSSAPRFEEIHLPRGWPWSPRQSRADITARLPHFVGSDAATAGAKLRSLRVLVIGCGAIGGVAALLLARLQIAALILLDSKDAKDEGLLTNSWQAPEDGSKTKAVAVGRKAKALSPATSLYSFAGKIQDAPLAALAKFKPDLMLVCTDNLAAEAACAATAAQLSVPVLMASVHGATMTFNSKFFPNGEPAKSACPVCSWSKQEWKLHDLAKSFSCDGSESHTDEVTGLGPTMSTASLCSLAAAFLVNQIVLWRLGLSVPPALLEYNGYTNRTVTATTLQRNPDCRLEAFTHLPWSVKYADRPVCELSLHDLARIAGVESKSATYELPEYDFCSVVTCSSCGHHQEVKKLCRRGGNQGECTKCRQAVQALPFFSRREFSELVFNEQQLQQPLRDLGIGAELDHAIVRTEDANFVLFEKECA